MIESGVLVPRRPHRPLPPLSSPIVPSAEMTADANASAVDATNAVYINEVPTIFSVFE